MNEKIEIEAQDANAKDWNAEIAKTRARLKKMESQRQKTKRKADTRKKLLAGIGILKAMAADKDLKAIALPAIQAALTPQDFETLGELMGQTL
jgi:ppGpp synthetase/RelA/SpoT-type nucleotidyltranferase